MKYRYVEKPAVFWFCTLKKWDTIVPSLRLSYVHSFPLKDLEKFFSL